MLLCAALGRMKLLYIHIDTAKASAEFYERNDHLGYFKFVRNFFSCHIEQKYRCVYIPPRFGGSRF